MKHRKKRLAALDAAIERGLADADAGRTKPAVDVFDRLSRKYQTKVPAPEFAPAFLTGDKED